MTTAAIHRNRRNRGIATILAAFFVAVLGCTGTTVVVHALEEDLRRIGRALSWSSSAGMRHRRAAEGGEGGTIVVGGYTSLDDDDDDDAENNSTSQGIDHAGARAVAVYVASHLDDPDLDGSLSGLSSSLTDGNIQVEIVRGYSQVVAGTNYRLLLLFLRPDNATTTIDAANSTAAVVNATVLDENDCIGAVAVEVYARFDGSFNITAWGNIVSCDRAIQLWNNPDADYGPTADDFDHASSSSSNSNSTNNASSSPGVSGGGTGGSGKNSSSDNTSSGLRILARGGGGLGWFPLLARLSLSLFLALSSLS